jgi:Spy/CpxP family protein refolding chaperone
MRLSFAKYAAVAALATGMVFAQAPAGTSQQPGTTQAQKGRRGFMRRHMGRVAQQLNLTDTQKQQSRAIFEQARQSAQPIRQELKQSREALRAAAKANQGDSQIQTLANQQGQLLGQLVAIRTEASAKFYQMLTPEQRAKADQMQTQFRQHRHSADRKNG